MIAIPHDKVEALIAEANARFVMPRFGTLQAGEIDEKKANDFVTVADREAEAFLAPRLADLIVGSHVLGEEAAAHDPSLMRRLDAETPLWVIDPVDGTRSFIEGKDGFAVIVALVRGDAVLAGWILQPRRARFVASEHGAGVRLDGGPPVIPAPRRARGYFLGRVPDGARARERAAAAFEAQAHPGSGAVAFLDMAAGAIDIAYFGRGWPWDHAAGALIAEELGGAARFLAGPTRYTPRRWNEPLLITRSPALWDDALRVLTVAT
ncbi:MAG: inositol monophosphatase [Alphaproteobacteria bacterium]|nr:inositol monophosphatase [Alphaproteobacteria bacterium]